jgi:hypothetical protein
LGREAILVDTRDCTDGRLVIAGVGDLFFDTSAFSAELGEETSRLASERDRFVLIRDSEFSASHFFIMSIARLPGVTMGEGLRLTHSHTVAALTDTELLAILMQLSQMIPHDFSLLKKNNGVSFSEKLLKGSQVFDVGG